jgi:SAM-dependent methyltransferase
VADLSVTELWDTEALVFDDEPHHSLEGDEIRGAWWDVMEAVMPTPPSVVVDLGCGTGSMSVLLAERGYDVVGLDLSPRMLDRATAKAQRYDVPARFLAGDAAAPALRDSSVDVVLTRHVFWALPEPTAVLDRWFDLLAPGGRLVLVEGRWHTGAGIESDDLRRLVERDGVEIDVTPLDDPLLWGHPITDSRYILTATT